MRTFGQPRHTDVLIVVFDASRSFLGRAAWTQLRRWYRKHGRHGLPWRKDRNPWRVLLAETVLHRTRADIAAALYPQLVREFPDPQAVLRRPDLWYELVWPAGLAWRAQAFLACCGILTERFGGHVPSDQAALEGLPGVGHYVAQAVRCFGFGIRTPLVDTNTIRLASRISGLSASQERHRSRAVQQLVACLAEENRPPDDDDNFALLDLAALVCLPRSPSCETCPLRLDCATGRTRAITKVRAARQR